MEIKLESGYLNHVVVESVCPDCEEETATDCGMIELSELPFEVEFFCDGCDRTWSALLDVKLEAVNEDG